MGSKMGDISVILSITTNIEKEGNVIANKTYFKKLLETIKGNINIPENFMEFLPDRGTI